ncbi:cupin domain-containing protein [Chitinophaga silvatica]|uniref:Cupin domain-containing protein n=1 Tax=Chitinophaga silvatica TaxID=2282649 RepID=A0A3E1Y2F9_9BACT|nr:cupin domain-containing protein [Chitinophaga silvatica]RFS18862.1 cupin domain-containing protein [Chitinophaga silvatica]
MQTVETSPFRSYQGGYFKTLIAPEQTNNALALLEITLPKGAEPPPHIHNNEDEAFYIVDGEISLRIADKVTVLKPGDAMFAPRKVPHSFEILTERATIMNLITPGTLWNFFMEFSQPLSVLPEKIQAPGPPPIEILQALQSVMVNKYQLDFVNS